MYRNSSNESLFTVSIHFIIALSIFVCYLIFIPKGITTLTEYLCPVCQKQLERYDYTKEKQAKSLLRCSELQTKTKPDHKNVVFFLTRQNNWWNKDFGQRPHGGQLEVTSSFRDGQLNLSENIKNCDRSARKTPPIRLKPP
jgi:hypothetical protein